MVICVLVLVWFCPGRYIGSDINSWDMSSEDTDLTEIQGMFLGENRIPKSMNAGTLANWGVWVHFTDNVLVLSP